MFQVERKARNVGRQVDELSNGRRPPLPVPPRPSPSANRSHFIAIRIPSPGLSAYSRLLLPRRNRLPASEGMLGASPSLSPPSTSPPTQSLLNYSVGLPRRYWARATRPRDRAERHSPCSAIESTLDGRGQQLEDETRRFDVYSVEQSELSLSVSTSPSSRCQSCCELRIMARLGHDDERRAECITPVP